MIGLLILITAVQAGCLTPEHFKYYDVIPPKYQEWYKKATQKEKK